MENQELITPELLKLLEHDCENITKLPKRYCGHLYALYLLAQFKEKRALPLIMKIISRRSERVLRFIFGDVLTEDLGRIIASVCGGELSPIKKLIEDERSNEYARCAGFDALLVLLAENVITRDELSSYLKTLFAKLKREPSLVWGDLAVVCCEIHPAEFYDELKQVFMDDLVNTLYITLEDINDSNAKSQEQLMLRLRQDSRYSYIENAIEAMQWWSFVQKQAR